MDDPVPVTVYRREHCTLCEEAIETVESIATEADIAVAIEEVDVDSDPQLREAHGDSVPVVYVDGRKQFEFRVDPTILVGVLRDATES